MDSHIAWEWKSGMPYMWVEYLNINNVFSLALCPGETDNIIDMRIGMLQMVLELEPNRKCGGPTHKDICSCKRVDFSDP